MPEQAQSTLVLGVGNELLGDDGFGVHVARTLQRMHPPLPPHVEIVDAGTSLLDCLPRMPGFSRVIILDAIRLGERPGSIHRMEVSRATMGSPGSEPAVSLHEVDVTGALAVAALMGLMPERVLIAGAEPDRIDAGIGLSPPLEDAAQRLVAMLLAEISAPLPATPETGLSG